MISNEEPPVEKIIRIGMDTSKSVFQLHGVDGPSSRYCGAS